MEGIDVIQHVTIPKNPAEYRQSEAKVNTRNLRGGQGEAIIRNRSRRTSRWHFWSKGKEIDRNIPIDYSTEEKEEQIRLIVDDNGTNWKILFVAASGFLASSYALFSIGSVAAAVDYVFPACGRLGHDPSLVIDEVTFAGTVCGMLIMGIAADRKGRKKLYGFELLLLIVATLGLVQASEGFMYVTINEENLGDSSGAYAHTMDIYAWISWWRFAIGFGIGAEYPLSSIITAEWASTESRGTMLAVVKSMQSLARLLAVLITFGALQHTGRASGLKANNVPNDLNSVNNMRLAVDQVWRLVVGIAAIPAAIAICARWSIPETPLYYAGIKKDLRKAVKKALKVYNKRGVEEKLATGGKTPPIRQDTDEKVHWLTGAKAYLHANPKVKWNLIKVTTLWAIMDICFYGLSLSNPSALATLERDSTTSTDSSNISKRMVYNSCPTDLTGVDIHYTLWFSSVKSLEIVTIASLLGSIVAILIVNFWHRKHILSLTFFISSICFAITGGSLIGTEKAGKDHTVTIVFYAITQFFYNIGPNTMIFVLASEIFPTVYRGTFNSLAAAGGKCGAILIRGIIGATGSEAFPLGIRLLVFVLLTLFAAWLSLQLPEVQERVKASDAEATGTSAPDGATPDVQHRNVGESEPSSTSTQGISVRESPTDANSTSSKSSVVPSLHGEIRTGFFSRRRLHNIKLEDIAPNHTRLSQQTS